MEYIKQYKQEDYYTEEDWLHIAKYRKLTQEELKKLCSLVTAREYAEDLAKFKKVLNSDLLKVKEMSGDGNCLFRAIADQYLGNQNMHSIYRSRTVDYIREHKDEYVPFIEDDQTIDQYCDHMAKDGIWGGQLEMKVLATILEFNVIVHRVDGTQTVQAFHKPLENYPILHLSYHLGAHYNSVRRGDDPILKGSRPILNYPIGTDLAKIKNMLQDQTINLDVEDDGFTIIDRPTEEVIIYAISQAEKNKTDLNIMSQAIIDAVSDYRTEVSKINFIDVHNHITNIQNIYEQIEQQAFEKVSISRIRAIEVKSYRNKDKNEIKNFPEEKQIFKLPEIELQNCEDSSDAISSNIIVIEDEQRFESEIPAPQVESPPKQAELIQCPEENNFVLDEEVFECKCPDGHDLKQQIGPITEYRNVFCDNCQRCNLNDEKTFFRCAPCKHDICVDCYTFMRFNGQYYNLDDYDL